MKKDDYQLLLDVEEIVDELRELAKNRIDKIRKELEPYRDKDYLLWDFDVIDCPECWESFYVFSPSERISECQLCGYEGGFVECSRCGEEFPSGDVQLYYESDELNLCDGCQAWLDRR